MSANRPLSFYIITAAALSVVFWAMSAAFIPSIGAPEGYTIYDSVVSSSGIIHVSLSLFAIMLITVSADAYAVRYPRAIWFVVICLLGSIFLGLAAVLGFLVGPIVPAKDVFNQAFAYSFAPTTLIVGGFITCVSLLIGLENRS